MARERLLISACLLGVFCKYDGSRKAQTWVSRLLERYELIPVCPEVLGGLPTPRPPAERRGDRVVTQAGGDVTDAYATGAAETLRLAELYGCKRALLKERSPSCGAGACYDGSFTHTCVPRDGVTAELLRAHGVTVLGESQAENL